MSATAHATDCSVVYLKLVHHGSRPVVLVPAAAAAKLSWPAPESR